nr:glycosyl hydrolase 108 family protein [uncultured Acetobacter sp.]
MDTNFTKIAIATEGREGLYSVTRSDAGNWTSGIVGVGRLVGSMRGISAPTMAHWLGSADLVTPQVMRDIDHKTFMAIAQAYYWRALNCGVLPSGLQRMLFDFGFNSGVARAARQLQEIVGLTGAGIDGNIGNKTLYALLHCTGVERFISSEWSHVAQQEDGTTPHGSSGPFKMAMADIGQNTRLQIYALASLQEQAYRSFKGFPQNGDGWLDRLRWRVAASLADLDAATSALAVA